MRRTTVRVAAAGAAAVAAAAVAPSWAGSHESVQFGKPVLISPDTNSGGYEPGVYADRFGNLYSTAHKENWQLALGPDSRSTTQTRSQSWAWYSSNGGKTWNDLPEGPGDLYNHMFGDEGDMAIDDANNLYMVDTDVTDITLTAWHIGNSGPAFDHANPLPGMGELVDDRPWVAAHLNGHVFYFGNEGDKLTYPAGNQDAGPGTGPGRYTVYKSTDGGATFDHQGITLKDSGWCRPAAAPSSPYVYVLCTNDGGADDQTTYAGQPGYTVGTIWAYVSANDGKTWKRYKVTNYNAQDAWFTWPSGVQVMRDGSIWMSYEDGQTPGCDPNAGDPVDGYGCTPQTAKIIFAHSTDHGKTWKVYNATPAGGQSKWQYRYGWGSVSPDGSTLGLGIYGRSSDKSPWYVYGATFKPGQHPTLTLLDKTPVDTADASSPPGDFLMSSFDAAGKFHVVYTRVTLAKAAYLMRLIFAVNQV